MMNPTQGWSPGMTLADVEREAIIAAFTFFRGNKTQTAASLGMAIRTLDYKIAEYRAKGALKKEDTNAEVPVSG